MKCHCGHETLGLRRLNHHRKYCAIFWQAVYDEMERIAVMRYGRIVPIAIDEWETYRLADFPAIKTFRGWGKSWTQMQTDSGHGVSALGRGASVAKGAPLKKPRWDRLENFPDYTATYSGEYDSLPPDGLAICAETYAKTGRMVLR